MQQQQLYHRTNNIKQAQHRDQEDGSLTGEKASYDEKKKKNDDRRPSPSRRTHPQPSRRRNIGTVKRTLQCLISMHIILSLLVYVVVVLVWKQEPSGPLDRPSIGPESAFDAEWWVSPNVTRAERILLVVAHRKQLTLLYHPPECYHQNKQRESGAEIIWNVL
jgi:hypothetical protein